ncbi:helix-turn-helix domain-containing protein [Kitasatospora sp. LaBMicrA B282]|uniref:helix-turn-helix domain-containing protein n=1 Tax=Kitasatospora sp. LaBMicrA B282 TaxID=3420949 RepID=UPI003D0CDCBC
MGSTSGGERDNEHVDFVSAEAKALYLEVIAAGGSVEVNEADLSSPYSELAELGLLVIGQGKPAVVTATDPEWLASRLSSAWQKQALSLLSQAVSIPAAMQELSRAYRSLDQQLHAGGPVEYVHGVVEINQRVRALVEAAQVEILTAQPGGSRRQTAVDEVAVQSDLTLLRRGVARRVLYHPSARYSAPARHYVERITEGGGAIRTLEEPFTRLFVIDRRIAVIPVRDDTEKAAFISDEAIVAYMVDSFERLWERSSPFLGATEVPPEVISRMRTNILRMMIQGVGHRVIARNLGISERTLARHIADFREEYGSETLFQLGWRMALSAPTSLYQEDAEMPDAEEASLLPDASSH